MMFSVVLILAAILTGCSKTDTPGGGNSGQNQTTDNAGGNSGQSQAGNAAGEDTSGGVLTESKQTEDTAEGFGDSAGAESAGAQETQSSLPETPDPGSSEISAVFHLDLLENKGLQDYDDARIKEIIVDPDGSSFVFWTTKTLTDLKLISVEYNGDQFLEGKIYCSYDEFTSADAILLTHSFPESMPDIKITFYDDKGTAQMYYISQSGQDNSPLLISEEALLFGN